MKASTGTPRAAATSHATGTPPRAKPRTTTLSRPRYAPSRPAKMRPASRRSRKTRLGVCLGSCRERVIVVLQYLYRKLVKRSHRFVSDHFDVVDRGGHHPPGEVGQGTCDGQFVADVGDVAVVRIEPRYADAYRGLVTPTQPRLGAGMAVVFVDLDCRSPTLARPVMLITAHG